MAMLIGADWASVDGNHPPDFASFKKGCADKGSRGMVAIMRGAWGMQRDLTIQRDWKRAHDAGLICGSYLFLRMPHQGFTSSPEDQVGVFAENLDHVTIGPGGGDLVPILDVEDTGLTASQELEWVHRAWLAMKGIYGAPPMLYTSARVWSEDLGDLPAGEMTSSPLWLAKPWPWRIRAHAQLSGEWFEGSTKYDPPVPVPWGPGNWWLHQYQGDAYPVPGFGSTVDLSRFHVMRVGEMGSRVGWVKRRLGMPATPAPAIPVFDSQMVTAVRSFQWQHRLDVDGVIGPQTFAALSWDIGSRPPTPVA